MMLGNLKTKLIGDRFAGIVLKEKIANELSKINKDNLTIVVGAMKHKFGDNALLLLQRDDVFLFMTINLHSKFPSLFQKLIPEEVFSAFLLKNKDYLIKILQEKVLKHNPIESITVSNNLPESQRAIIHTNITESKN
jgi:hypothetical protein